MRVASLDNAHLRVREHLLEAAGFNITYEVVAESGGVGVREDACIYHHCSFTGVCFASPGYERYECGCFEGYFGDECQYDEGCGPHSAQEVCRNGGTCRYYIGSSVRTCECLPGYIGAKCENFISSKYHGRSPNHTDDVTCLNSQHPTTHGYISIYPKDASCHFKTSSLILRLEISEPMPVAEGAPLLVACIVVGGKDVAVKWLKDGSPVALGASKGRLWCMRVPRDSQGRDTFLLGFDVTKELDAGTITCTVHQSDPPLADALSVDVSVLPRSTLLVEPLSATVARGDTLKITCVAEDMSPSRSGSRRYAWRKDGQRLGEARRGKGRGGNKEEEEEAVEEDLYPVGSRLIVRGVRRSANYSCLMKTDASATASEIVAVTVLEPADFLAKTCAPEKSVGVRWKVTSAGSVDVNKCPSGYTGYIRRRCEAIPGQPIGWEEPDFSTCHSPTMLAMKKEFESRPLGYRKRTLNALLRELLAFLGSKHAEMHQSEAEPIVEMLEGVDVESYAESHVITPSDWNLTLSIASILFHSNIVHKHRERVKLHSLVRNVTSTYGENEEARWTSRFSSNCLTVRVYTVSFARGSPVVHLPWCLDSGNYCGAVHLTVEQRVHWSQTGKQDNVSVAIAIILYRCLHLSGLSNAFESSGGANSSLISVDVTVSRPKNISVTIQTSFTALAMAEIGAHSKLHCFRITLLPSREGRSSPCHAQRGVGNSSYCACKGGGLMSFRISQDKLPEFQHFHSFHLIVSLASGCVLLTTIALFAAMRFLWDIRRKINLHL